jgi:hypothetical protein
MWRQDRRQYSYGRRLPGTVRAEDAEHHAALDGHREPLEGDT